jgi:hypothetical protein
VRWTRHNDHAGGGVAEYVGLVVVVALAMAALAPAAARELAPPASPPAAATGPFERLALEWGYVPADPSALPASLAGDGRPEPLGAALQRVARAASAAERYVRGLALAFADGFADRVEERARELIEDPAEVALRTLRDSLVRRLPAGAAARAAWSAIRLARRSAGGSAREIAHALGRQAADEVISQLMSEGRGRIRERVDRPRPPADRVERPPPAAPPPDGSRAPAEPAPGRRAAA